MTREQEYKDAFGPNSGGSNKKSENALEHALDIRKFEIGLYWQRATYFWTLIAATFAGYFAVLAAEHMKDKEFNAFVLACIGVVFSLAWFLTNRGSKFWQENWENHVDMLEDELTGPLYKTILHRPKEKSLLARFIEGPAPYSVSQINQWVSLFTILMWGPLIVNVLPDKASDIYSKHLVIGAFTAIAVLMMLFRTKSEIVDGDKRTVSVKRKSIIEC